MKQDGLWKDVGRFVTDEGATPLIALSAVLCVLELFTPLRLIDFSVFGATTFYTALRYRQRTPLLHRAASVLLLSLLLYVLFGAAEVIAVPLAKWLSNKPVLFGPVNDVYTLLFGNALSEAVYHTGCVAAVITEKGIVGGVIEVVKAATPSATRLAAQYLTGSYYENLFLPLGVIAALWPKCQKRRRAALLAAFGLSLFAGDGRIFSLLLVMEPTVYVAFLLSTALAFLTASLLGIGVAFTDRASLPELLANVQQPILFVSAGVLLAVTAFFITKYVNRKWGRKDEFT
ncbi:MAG: hypothetical protein IJ168_10955 [Eubacterium sp.]|nr:hypothetical protein [Eubacterium sp.]